MAYTGTSLILPGSLTTSQTEGIIGTTTSNNADVGSVGEYVESIIIAGSAISLTTTTLTDVTSISLTAGDWQVFGNIGFVTGTATNIQYMTAWVSTTSVTQPDDAYVATLQNASGGVAYNNNVNALGTEVPTIRLSISSPTTVYLSCIADFSVSTLSAFGGILARRMR